MKLKSYLLDDVEDEDELRACLEAMQEEVPDPLLVTVYGVALAKVEAAFIARKIKKIFPDVHVIAGCVDAVISGGRGNSWGVSLTFISFEHTELKLLVQHEGQSREAYGEELRAGLAALPDLVCVMVLWGGQMNALPAVISEFKQPFFGGLLYDITASKHGFIYADGEIIESGAVCVAFCSTELEVMLKVCSSWQPIGPSLRVTAIDGPYVVKELDGMPFDQVYDYYIGNVAGESFMDKSLSFPIILHRNGRHIARQPLVCRKDGAAEFGADFELGDVVQFGYGDPARVIYDTQRKEKEISTFRPQALFLFDCLSRWLLMEGQMEHELKNCRQIAPSFGFYSYGELIGAEGDFSLLNMSLVLVGMREGSGANLPQVELNLDEVIFARHQQFLAHLVHLVQVTTAALELKNDQLGYQARTDALTGLSNRGAIEAAIKGALEGGRGFAVIMLDVDNFKGINDNLGHDVGDESLKTLAVAIRDQIRAGDIAGRWGGDEFLVLLPGQDIRGATKAAERIRQVVRGYALPDGSHFTLSIGITAYALGDDELSLFRRVDKALYAAKSQEGKDAIVVR